MTDGEHTGNAIILSLVVVDFRASESKLLKKYEGSLSHGPILEKQLEETHNFLSKSLSTSPKMFCASPNILDQEKK